MDGVTVIPADPTAKSRPKKVRKNMITEKVVRMGDMTQRVRIPVVHTGEGVSTNSQNPHKTPSGITYTRNPSTDQ